MKFKQANDKEGRLSFGSYPETSLLQHVENVPKPEK